MSVGVALACLMMVGVLWLGVLIGVLLHKGGSGTALCHLSSSLLCLELCHHEQVDLGLEQRDSSCAPYGRCDVEGAARLQGSR